MDSKEDQVGTGTTEDPVPQNASSEEIREDIRGTRRGMDETLDEIGERLHPRHLLDDIFDLFRGGERASNSQLARTSKDVGRTVSRAVREHPLPALLVGAGIAWRIVDAVSDGEDNRGQQDESYWERSRRRASATSRKRDNEWYDSYSSPRRRTDYAPLMAQEREEPNEGEKSNMEKAGEKIKGAASAVGDKVSDAGSAVGDKLAEAASAVGDTFRQGSRALGSAASDSWERGRRSLQDYSAYGTQAVTRQAGMLKDRFNLASDEYPLAMGGVFLAAGVLVGLLLPRSEKEDEWMGETSDQMKDEARNVAQQAVEKGKSVATETAAAVMDEAEAQGITPENIVDKTSQIGSEALTAAQDSARRETS